MPPNTVSTAWVWELGLRICISERRRHNAQRSTIVLVAEYDFTVKLVNA